MQLFNHILTEVETHMFQKDQHSLTNPFVTMKDPFEGMNTPTPHIPHLPIYPPTPPFPHL